MLVLAACAAPDPAPLEVPVASEERDAWSALAEESVFHLGFETVEPDRASDDSPSGLDALAWEEDDLAARLEPGPHGNALAFDGVDDFLYVEDADALDLAGAFTVLAWMRADPRDDGVRAYPLVDKYSYVGRAWTGYGAWLDGGQPYAGIYAGIRTATECGGPRIGVFDDGDWHLYAAIYDGSTLLVTVDAERARACDWTLPPIANADFLEIGTRGGSYFFAGALDEVTIVPRAVTIDEVDTLLTE